MAENLSNADLFKNFEEVKINSNKTVTQNSDKDFIKIDRFTRARALFDEKFEILQNAKILVCGCGGVGGAAISALYRSGVTHLSAIDNDKFEITNQNRQILSENLGVYKTAAFEQNFSGVKGICEKIDENFVRNFNFSEFDFVIDAVDDIKAKILLAKICAQNNLNFISSMGAAKRLDPLQIRTASIWKTKNDPFARKFREELKKADFKGDFEVVFSLELPQNINALGSFMAVTATFGNILAAKVIEKLIF